MSEIESSSVEAELGSGERKDDPGAEPSRRPAARYRRRLWPAALFLLLVLGAALRFYGLGERGLYGSDVVYYTEIAKLWSEGERVYSLAGRRDTYRPVVFALYAAAIQILGFEDDSIKKLNAGLDVANIALVFWLGFLIGRRRAIPAFVPALLYAALPLALYMSRTELTHTISTFCVLLTLLAAVWVHGNQDSARRRIPSLIAAGFCAALATLTHEELLFAVGGLGLWLAGVATLRAPAGVTRRLRAAAITSALFLFPLLLGVSGMVVHHWDHASTLIGSWLSEGPSGSAEPVAQTGTLGKVALQIEKTARFFWNATTATSSLLFAYLAVIAFLVLMWRLSKAWRRRREDLRWLEENALVLLAPTVIGVHLVLFALFFPYLFPRLFLPLLPLLLIFISAVLSAACRETPKKARRFVGASLIVLIPAALILNLEQFSRRQAFMARDYAATWVGFGGSRPFDPAAGWAELRETSYRKSWAREIYEILGDRVDASARLLITSSLMYPHPARRELQAGYYFGDDAVYLFDHGAPIEELVEDFEIRYVLYSSYRADRRFMKKDEVRHYLGAGAWSESRETFLGKPLGLSLERFHLGTEYRALQDFFQSSGARRLNATGTFASGEAPSFTWADESYVIYELPRARHSMRK